MLSDLVLLHIWTQGKLSILKISIFPAHKIDSFIDNDHPHRKNTKD